MAEIVAAFGVCHAPQLIWRPPDEKPEMLDASIAAMAELGKVLDETKPDVILFLGSDHLETFSSSEAALTHPRRRAGKSAGMVKPGSGLAWC